MKKIGFIAYLSFSFIFVGLFTYVGLQSRGVDPTQEPEKPKNKEYLALAAPVIEELENRSWEAPPAQDDEGFWQYEVFTPPKIYVNEKGELDAQPPKPPEVKKAGPVEYESPVFGVALQSVFRPPFRVLLRGVIRNPQEPEKSFVQLEYLNIPEPAAGMTQTSILGKKTLNGIVGKYWEAEKIRIKQHSLVEVPKNGLPTKVDKITIEDYTAFDAATNKVFAIDLLPGTNPVPGPDVFVTLVSSESPSTTLLFRKNLQKGFKFKLNLKDKRGVDYEAIFTVEDFKESPPEITLRKEFEWVRKEGEPAMEDVQTEVLSLSGVVPTSPGSVPLPATVPGSSLPIPGNSLPVPGSMPVPSGTGVLPPPSPLPGSSSSLPFPPVPGN
jgi:hypothetical protein